MISVNLFAQPGAGKSTTAAFLFHYFKSRGFNVELVTEYAKQLVYSKRNHEMANQVYLLAKQYKKMKDIEQYGQVPIIFTDSPLLLGLAYCDQMPYLAEIRSLMHKLHEEFENINVGIRRTKPYNPSGRNQSEEESDALAGRIEALIDFDYVVNGDTEGQQTLAEKLHARFAHLALDKGRNLC